MNTAKRFRPAERVDGTVTPLAGHPEYADALAELQELEKLHAQRLADRKRLIMRAQGARVKRSPAERARDLLAGGRVDAIPVASQIQGIDEELDVLRGAIIEKTRALDAVASKLSYVEAEKVRPLFHESMKQAMAGMEATVAAFGRAADVADELRRAGYRVSSVQMPDLMPHGVRLLQGDGLAQFKRALAEVGVV